MIEILPIGISKYAYNLVKDITDPLGDKYLNFLKYREPDGDGGWIIVWRNGSCEVKLVARDNPDLPSYIYHQAHDGMYSVDYELTPSNLNSWLERLERQ